MKTAIITISTSIAAKRSENHSNETLTELAGAANADVVAHKLVSDDQDAIEQTLRKQLDTNISLIFTTNNTKLTRNNVTPKTTKALIDRDAPKFAKTIQTASLKHTPINIL